jgi:hypothetical protein
MELKIKTKQHRIKPETQRKSKRITGISAKQRRLFWLKIVFPAVSKTLLLEKLKSLIVFLYNFLYRQQPQLDKKKSQRFPKVNWISYRTLVNISYIILC